MFHLLSQIVCFIYSNKIFSFVFQISNIWTFDKRTISMKNAKGYAICFGTFDKHERSQRLCHFFGHLISSKEAKGYAICSDNGKWQ